MLFGLYQKTRRAEMKRMNRSLLTLGLLALFGLPASAQDQGASHPALRSLSALVDAVRHTANPISITPELAEGALLIDDVLATPQGKVEVRLRNGGEKAITAWSIDVVSDDGSGSAHVVSHAVDHHIATAGAPDKYSPLRPAAVRAVEYDVPVYARRSGGTDVSVLGVEVGAVVFDDGSVAGRDVRPVLRFVLDRIGRAGALTRLLGRVDSALQAGALEELLDESLARMAQESQQGVAAVLHGAAPETVVDQQRRRETVLAQQWLQSLLVFTARNSSRSELEDLLQGLNTAEGQRPESYEFLKAMGVHRPEMLQAAIAGTRLNWKAELDALRQHLPASLRAELVEQ